MGESRRVGWAVLVGGALGIASFCADLVDGALRAALQFLASTGFAWGCAAFVSAFPVRTRRAAVVAAVCVLGAATVCYYGLNFASGRWRVDGLGPVLTALAYWLLLSLVGGLVLGGLAHTIRADRPPLAALAAGLACGLLAGAGIAIVVTTGTGLAAGLLQAVAGVAVATWAFGRRRGPRPWPGYALAAAAACLAGALAWSAVESVPVIGF